MQSSSSLARALLERLGACLRELRAAANLSQEEVGERAGFGKYIDEIEKGLRDVPNSTLRAVVENGLGLRIDAAFAGKPMRLAAVAIHSRDVELTAEASSRMPLRLRRPLLALVKVIGDDVGRSDKTTDRSKRPRR